LDLANWLKPGLETPDILLKFHQIFLAGSGSRSLGDLGVFPNPGYSSTFLESQFSHTNLNFTLTSVSRGVPRGSGTFGNFTLWDPFGDIWPLGA